MSSINSLLNHEPAPEPQRRASRPSISQESGGAKTTTYEAADALTTLATLGSGQQYAPTPPVRELPSPTLYTQAPRRTSSFGSHIAPVEPSPPIDHPQPHSPTLDQYHHGSRSPEEQRRQSFLVRTSPAPVLAPIQSLSDVLHERIRDEPAQESTSYGKDVSQMVPPPSRSSNHSEVARDDTQDREPAFVREEATTSQIREPEPPDSTPQTEPPTASLPHELERRLPSPPPMIKNEPSVGTPRDPSPATIVQTSERHHSIAVDDVDAETRKAIEALKQNDLGLRTKRTASIAESITSPVEPKPAPAVSKKRPAPSTIKKKGTAAPKKPSKKRRLDTDTDGTVRSTTLSRPSNPSKTNGKKSSHAGTPTAGSSPAPDNSSQVHASDDEAESSEDDTLYCICRKPDNHKWMIGCDGGCDDWFHGSCVNMQQADEDLVDKFICPNCEAAGRGETTWKPMCRRQGCRKPARLAKSKESKYCSDECGVLFFQEQLQRTAGAKKTSSKKKKKSSKDGEEQGGVSDEDEEPTPLGGVLRSKDLKALAVASKDIEAFKRLGSGVLSPPQTASPTKPTFDSNGTMQNGTADPINDLPYTSSEKAHLNALKTEKADLNVRLELLKDREKFVSMVREQATRLAEKEKIKVKEFCGYDARLAWSDAEFLRWRRSRAGQAAFRCGTLDPPVEEVVRPLNGGGDGDVTMNGNGNGNGVVTNGQIPDQDEEDPKSNICAKKRCTKHPQWQKLNLQDARFEEMEVVEAIKECEKEERAVRERASRRRQKEAVEMEVIEGEHEGDKRGEKNREGWVQVVH
jgi:COMPASS component SPP1